MNEKINDFENSKECKNIERLLHLSDNCKQIESISNNLSSFFHFYSNVNKKNKRNSYILKRFVYSLSILSTLSLFTNFFLIKNNFNNSDEQLKGIAFEKFINEVDDTTISSLNQIFLNKKEEFVINIPKDVNFDLRSNISF